MPVTVNWDDHAHSIILMFFETPWTWEEFDTAIAQTVERAGSVEHRVDLIMDFRHGKQIPHSLPLPHVQQALSAIPPNAGDFISVGIHGPAFIDNIWLKAHGYDSEVILVETIDQAYTKIDSRRQASGGMSAGWETS
jgi:hypothetical protein